MELTVFVCHDTMTEEEKKEHPEYETIGGYLKSLSFREACAIWWEKLSKEDRDTVMTIPNFDAAIFEEITGIKV